MRQRPARSACDEAQFALLGPARVSVDGVTRFACTDGPDFDAHAVDFDELVVRQRRFKEEETAASADYEHRCQVEQTLFVEGRRTYKKLREIEPTKVPMPERDTSFTQTVASGLICLRS